MLPTKNSSSTIVPAAADGPWNTSNSNDYLFDDDLFDDEDSDDEESYQCFDTSNNNDTYKIKDLNENEGPEDYNLIAPTLQNDMNSKNYSLASEDSNDSNDNKTNINTLVDLFEKENTIVNRNIHNSNNPHDDNNNNYVIERTMKHEVTNYSWSEISNKNSNSSFVIEVSIDVPLDELIDSMNVQVNFNERQFEVSIPTLKKNSHIDNIDNNNNKDDNTNEAFNKNVYHLLIKKLYKPIDVKKCYYKINNRLGRVKVLLQKKDSIPWRFLKG